MKRILLRTIAWGLAAALPLCSVSAQVSDEDVDPPASPNQAQPPEDRTQPRTDQREDRTKPQTDRRQRRSPRDGSASRESEDRPLLPAPGGWITIFADFDQDGRIDSKEQIHVLDLMHARRDSRQRQRAEFRRHRSREDSHPRNELIELQGTIEDQAEFALRGHDDKFLIARLKKEDDKTARVVLGTKQDLKALKLSEGQSVTVRGERHLINNKPVLFARTISAEGQTVNVAPPKSAGEQRVRGTIESLEKRRFRGRDGEFVVAQVDLVNGRSRTVNLGPSSKLQSLNLQEGDEVRILGRRGRINDRPALIAAQVNAKGATVSTPRSRQQSPDIRPEDQTDRQVDRRQDFDATRNR